jgi:hypothetical protein
VQDNAGGGQEEEGHQLLNVTLAQGCALPDNWAYLDGCSTVTAFKDDKYLKGVKKVREGIKINCNAGLVTTNLKGNYGRLKVWHVPKGIANIFSMHKLECFYRITYDSRDRYYVVHPTGRSKDSQGQAGPTVHQFGQVGSRGSCAIDTDDGKARRGEQRRH